MWWICGITLLFLELLSVGVAFLAKTLGDDQWYLALIPIYGLKYLGDVAGTFKVLAVPVKKCGAFFAELLLVAFLCGLYWYWGTTHVSPKGVPLLGQIMLLPIVLCYALMYFAILSASHKIYRRFHVQHTAWAMIASLFLLPIPVIYYRIRNNEVMSLSEMFD